MTGNLTSDQITAGKKHSKSVVGGKRKRGSNLGSSEVAKRTKFEAPVQVDEEMSSSSTETPVPPSAIPSRLQERLAEIKATREARTASRGSVSPILSISPPLASSTSSPVPDENGPKSREEMLVERKRRGELRDKRRKATKLRKKQEKWEQRQEEKKAKKAEKDRIGVDKLKEEQATKQKPTPSESALPVASTSAKKIDVDLDSANFHFSTLDFTPVNTTDIATSNSAFKKPAKNSTETALSAIEKRRKFLDKLNPACRERAMDKDMWTNATKKAEGIKVADQGEEAKLKKSLKKKEKLKEKSRKDWKERKMQVADKMKERQQKRSENLAARAQAKKDKRMGVKAKKVGKARPGFEGGKVRKSGAMGKRK